MQARARVSCMHPKGLACALPCLVATHLSGTAWPAVDGAAAGKPAVIMETARGRENWRTGVAGAARAGV
jgi:hypothetical protein